MFGDAQIIEASRQFVCVRPETYESEENQQMIRSLLGGKMENTAFCLLSPDGTKRLSSTGRGFTRDVSGARDLDRVALQFQPTGRVADSLTPDFNSFRIALNTAAADSRVLVLVSAPKSKIAAAEKRMRQVAWDDDIVGRFHFDVESNVKQIRRPLGLSDRDNAYGILVIHPGTFGVNGKVVTQLPLNAKPAVIIAAMKSANDQYAKNTKRKTYTEHVAEGKSSGYYFEMKMEYGEDHDGDGTPDGNSTRRYTAAKERSFQTGNYFPDVSQAK